MALSGQRRGQAAADRAYAARDRRQAAADRERRRRTASSRPSTSSARSHDSLTGVYMRDLGRVTLQHEIDRSRRSGEPYLLAFVDVDGLKDVNDRDGHAAGDMLLAAVIDVLKANLRSYDPIVRIGGDEFVCGFTNTEREPFQHRVDEIRAAVMHGPAAGSITVGLASLGPTDTLDDLTARADVDMYSHKPSRAGRVSGSTQRRP